MVVQPSTIAASIDVHRMLEYENSFWPKYRNALKLAKVARTNATDPSTVLFVPGQRLAPRRLPTREAIESPNPTVMIPATASWDLESNQIGRAAPSTR
ncbi:hypothetical protein OGAPHI_006913 [Ogataea philodendri]|uniref:Uncharacterized protein n=1 Tax=Ogataea philodendri TaxID=1378263 RepID=A0A9P8NW70_9ASCO|nr:uncharacterized protein OGAPHI_006913 [Ogataea philodendri]KAH3660327.1 hypothetical protein OGAPHI_006913 [Ogataea philodendri]